MKKLLFTLLAALTLTACAHNEHDDTIVFSNFATLDAISARGAILSVQNPGEKPVYTLTASQEIRPDGFTVGSRVFISYTTESNTNTASEPCTLQAMFPTEGGGAAIVEATAEETDNWSSNEVQLTQATITGNYINLVGAAVYTDDNECQLYVDRTTLNDAYPAVHLVMLNKGVSQQYYTLLGSWDYTGLLSSGNCKGFMLYANNPNMSSPVKIEF